jgi:hypothetical protein
VGTHAPPGTGVCSLLLVQLPGAARPGVAEFESAAATVPFARALLRCWYHARNELPPRIA